MDRTVDIQGTPVPRIGLGTWQVTGRACVEAVRDALEIGYRHLDTARMYGNEAEVGAGLRDSGVARDEIFLTTKVWVDDLEPARVRRSCESSLRDLGTEYVDLLLIHWPSEDVPVERTLEAMTELRDAGRIRHLGVSNFPAGLLRRAADAAPIFCDQVEYHVFLGQERLLELARERGVLVSAYSPLAQGLIADDPVLGEIAAAHDRTPGQVALRWLLEQEIVVPLPKSASPERRRENFDIWDFELSADERARIDALPKDRRLLDGSLAPDWSL